MTLEEVFSRYATRSSEDDRAYDVYLAVIRAVADMYTSVIGRVFEGVSLLCLAL